MRILGISLALVMGIACTAAFAQTIGGMSGIGIVVGKSSGGGGGGGCPNNLNFATACNSQYLTVLH